MKYFIIVFVCLISFFTHAAVSEIKSLLVHPLFNEYYVCAEHWDGQLKELGDALGTDCIVSKMVEKDGLSWLRQYDNQGRKNEDWFGWRKSVLAPIAGKITKININNVTNTPGKMGQGPASFIIIQRNDGINVVVAHVQEVTVKVDDSVKAGQSIALVGNNGQSRHPHIHIGAWQNSNALQIRFNQTKMEGRP